LKELSKITNEFSGAEIKAVCTEAGYSAIRDKRYKVNQNDFLFAVNKVKVDEDKEHLSMFV
jgi:proteasome regulatory subunit